MHKFRLIIVCIILANILNNNMIHAQILDSDRSTNWKKAGSNFGDTLKNIHFLNIADFGAIPNDGLNDDDALAKALAERIQYQEGIQINFDEGVYNFEKNITINKNKIIISGLSNGKTIFEFNLSKENNAISILGEMSSTKVAILGDAIKGTDIIIIENTELFPPNSIIKIQDDDTELITSAWAKGSTGQICTCVENINTGIMIEEKLRRTYRTLNNTTIQKINPVQFIEISNIVIKRTKKTDKQTSNILVSYGKDIILKCIESYYCNFAHIDIRNSKNIEVYGSYFEDAFEYGGGGKGYGVVVHSSSSDCLVHKNIFKHLRHSMLLQSGANGNVIAYNYSCEPYWTGVSLPSNSAGDIVLHGNYPYLNLFEGNICQNIVIDDSHGKNGPYNTFLRNRAELYGIFMNFNPASDSINFIGNEITSSELFKGLYMLNGNEHFEYGNNVLGTIKPNNTTILEDKSYYLTEGVPSFYKENSNWVPIGIPNKLNQYINEAKYRYENSIKTKCQEEENSIIEIENDITIRVYPNPCQNKLYIKNNSNSIIQEASIYSYSGNIIEKFDYPIEMINFDKEYYVEKIYFLKILLNTGEIIRKKIILDKK